MKRFNVTRGEALLGVAFTLASFASLAMLISRGHVLTGAENQVGADQLQYLSWIVSSGEHWTIRSLWSIPAQSSSSFVHPGFLISGLLNRAGLDPLVAFQVWKPFAILLVLAASIAYVRRHLPAGGGRTAALAIALFGLSPAGALLGWGSLHGGFRGQLEFAAGEVFAVGWLWGYMMTALAVGLLVFALIVAELSLSRQGTRWVVLAAVFGLLCSWLQPWQGAELIAAVLICDLLRPSTRGRRATILRHLPLLVATLLPLVYYRWLSATEDVWRIAGEANNSVSLWSAGVWLLTFAIYAPALVALRSRAEGWQQMALRVVPAVMLLEYGAIAVTGSGTFPFHAVQGIGLFLGILTVQGMREIRNPAWWASHRSLAVGLCLFVCVPGVAHRIDLMRLEIHRSAQPYFLESGEDAALTALSVSSVDGGVLAPIKAALVVPARTGRPVWVGELSWTPDFRQRVIEAEKLFKGELTTAQARALVADSGAAFIYTDCGHPFDVRRQLGAMVRSSRQFGCARIDVLSPTSPEALR